MDTSDHDLMSQLAAGNDAALEVLVRRWEGPVARVLGRLVRNDADVEDLGQEVFMRVFSASRRYRPMGEFSTWLFRIVINATRDAARHRRRRVQPRQISDAIVGSPAAPENLVSRREVDQLIRQSLDALPERFREVLVLKHFGNLTFAEMSQVLGKPVSTIKSRTQTALQKLHLELQKRGIHRSELEQ